MTDTPGPLAESPLALALGMIAAGEASGLEPADLTFLYQHGLINGEQEGIHLRERGTQTLAALTDWREEGEPFVKRYGDGERQAIWNYRGAWELYCDEYLRDGVMVWISGRIAQKDMLLVAACVQAAHRLAQQWREERAAKEANPDE